MYSSLDNYGSPLIDVDSFSTISGPLSNFRNKMAWVHCRHKSLTLF